MAQRPKQANLARERKRRVEPAAPRPDTSASATSRRSAAATCGWCGGAISLKPVGRIPKWCSAACRQRAWEQARAAASGRAAVEVVERIVAVPVEHVRAPRHGEWPALLRELAEQLDAGRIYARDVPELATALDTVHAALGRHPASRRRSRS